MEVNKIINRDCLEVLKTIESNSIDLIASDPPYQLSQTNARTITAGFMNKVWDVLPSLEILKECLRVLKPGSFAFWLMTPRQDSHMEFLMRLKETGFVISFTPIIWCYSTGFPKSSNTMKAIEKRGLTDISKKFDGAYSGFQPKPCFEVIVTSMKPLSEKSYVDQAIKNGKGVTFLDEGRIPYASEEDKEGTLVGYDQADLDANMYNAKNQEGGFGLKKLAPLDNPKGRFAPNLLVCDDALNNGEITKTQPHNGDGLPLDTRETGGGFKRMDYDGEDEGSYSRYFSLDAWWEEKIKSLPKEMRRSIEDVFPFLIVPKPAKSEKDNGLDDFSEKQKWGDGGVGTGISDRVNIRAKNIHPTVKPLQLMSYLIHLGSRENDVVLDPFMGSGTTCLSARTWNRKYLGIEREKEYYEIALGRLSELEKQKKLGDFFD